MDADMVPVLTVFLLGVGSAAAIMFSRGARRKGAALLGCAVAFALIATIIAGRKATYPRLRAGDVPVLKNQGNAIVRQLEKFKEVHGTYPSGLAELSPVPQKTRYGNWNYSSADNGTRFVLSVGDYRKHEFNLYWRYGKKEWFLNG